MVFTPNSQFRLLPVSEREKYIFPPEIDISKAVALNHPGYTQDQSLSKNDMNQGDTLDQISDEKSDAETIDASASDAKPFENILDQFNNRLYGSFWLLEEISRNKGVYEDLLEVFQGNIGQVHEVMSLAFFPYLSGKCFNRFAKGKTLTKHCWIIL